MKNGHNGVIKGHNGVEIVHFVRGFMLKAVITESERCLKNAFCTRIYIKTDHHEVIRKSQRSRIRAFGTRIYIKGGHNGIITSLEQMHFIQGLTFKAVIRHMERITHHLEGVYGSRLQNIKRSDPRHPLVQFWYLKAAVVFHGKLSKIIYGPLWPHLATSKKVSKISPTPGQASD